MLTVYEPSEFALAIISEDVKMLTAIPGIGPKSAKRIILELKDKIKTSQEAEAIKAQIENKDKTQRIIQKAIMENSRIEEATTALQVLGYNKKEIEKAFEKIDVKDLKTEELIKKALKILGS